MLFSVRVIVTASAMFGLALISCQSPGPVSISPKLQSPAAADYQDILASYTRRDHVYAFFADKADLRATFHSMAYKQAFAAAKAQFHGRSADLIGLYLQDQKPAPTPLQSLSEVVKPFNAKPEDEAQAQEKTLSFSYTAE